MTNRYSTASTSGTSYTFLPQKPIGAREDCYECVKASVLRTRTIDPRWNRNAVFKQWLIEQSVRYTDVIIDNVNWISQKCNR
jgi:hypothetical protein